MRHFRRDGMAGPAIRLLRGVPRWLSACAVLCACGQACAERVELKREGGKVTVTRGGQLAGGRRLSLVFDAAGRGFVTAATLDKAVVCAASERSGLFASLIVPRAGARPLEPVAGEEVAAAVTVDSVRQAAGQAEVTIAGKAAFAGVGEAPFTVRVEVPAAVPAPKDALPAPAMVVRAELALPPAARRAYLSSFGLAVPLALTFQPTSAMKAKVDRKTVAAAILPRFGTPIPEVRWMVARQDDQNVWGPMLWSLAGIRQAAPAAFEVWEAWSSVNPPFVLQHHHVHPGWMAVADGRAAVAAGLAGIDKVAPKEIYVDGAAQVLRICFQSPYARPIALASAPKTLTAGPAYVFVEASPPGTRKAEDYARDRTRPALAKVGEALAKLPATRCNFGPPAPRQTISPARRAEPAPVPADPAFASHEPSPPDEIGLWLDPPAGAEPVAAAVTRGIPLKRGVLRDARQAALLDAAGQAVPCASRAAAYWPDGSVKWLLLDFLAAPAGKGGSKYKLLVGEKARPVVVPRPLKVAEARGEVTVDTGPLKLTAADRAGKLALTVALDLNGDGQVGADETVVRAGPELLGCVFSHLADSSGYRSGTWLAAGRDDPGSAELTELRVEEQSPLRAVVLIRADLKHKLLASTIPQEHRPKVGTPVTLRLHVYAGSRLVRVQHTFLFAGDVNHDFLRQLGVRLPVPAEAGQTVRTSLGGTEVSAARDGEMGLLQEGPDSALVWRSAGGKLELPARGVAADGWLDVTGRRWGVAVGLRHMRETFPKEIHVDASGVWAHFYSPRVRPMDVRRYAFKYGDGESTSTGWGTAFGALRTHEACWSFHAAGVADRRRAVGEVRAMLDPPLARVRPRHVADTLAVGHVAEHGAATNDAHQDAALLHMPRMYYHNLHFWRWLGFWNFGDEIQVYNAHRHRWARDDGRYGWFNNEPIRDYNYHLAYLMTGNRRLWRQAEAMSYQVFEVDVRHANPQPFMGATAALAKQRYSHSTTRGIDLCGRRHNCQHWADGYFGPRIGSPPGFRLCYYQTGDPVMREHLQRLLASAMAMRWSRYMHADGDEAILWAMIMGHEMTREQKYLDRIRAYVNLQVDFAKEHDGIPAGQANWDWASNTTGAPPAEPRDDLWMWSFGGLVAMIEVADLFGDAKVDHFLREWTLALEGLGPDKKRREKWSNHIGACPLLAYYYRRTGDRRALDWFRQRAKRWHNGIPKDAPREDLPADVMGRTFPAYTPHDGYGWVYTTPTFWYVGIPAWQGALRARAGK